MNDKKKTSINQQALKLAKRLTSNDLKRLAKNNEIIALNIPGIELIQLIELAEIAAPLPASFSFSLDANDSVCIHLTSAVTLMLVCQRCLQPFAYDCTIDVIFSPITASKDAKSLPESYEPFIFENDQLSLVSLLEEELILSIPLIPKHSDISQCGVKDLIDDEVAHRANQGKSSTKTNPFAVLKKLKKE